MVLSKAKRLVNKSSGMVKKMVLSGLVTGMSNRFACNAVDSKMSHSTDNGSNSAKAKKLYTDTGPEIQTEIITDINVKKPSKAGNLLIEVKVDPG